MSTLGMDPEFKPAHSETIMLEPNITDTPELIRSSNSIDSTESTDSTENTNISTSKHLAREIRPHFTQTNTYVAEAVPTGPSTPPLEHESSPHESRQSRQSPQQPTPPSPLSLEHPLTVALPAGRLRSFKGGPLLQSIVNGHKQFVKLSSATVTAGATGMVRSHHRHRNPLRLIRSHSPMRLKQPKHAADNTDDDLYDAAAYSRLATDAELLHAAKDWLLSRAAACETEDDFENYGSWGELLVGLEAGRLRNCFLGGTGDTPGFIDSGMAQFAGFRCIQTTNHNYLTWLGFVRAVDYTADSFVMHAHGPLLKVRETELEETGGDSANSRGDEGGDRGTYCHVALAAVSKPLGAEWSIGYRPFGNIPRAAHYAHMYIWRVHRLAARLPAEPRSPPAAPLHKLLHLHAARQLVEGALDRCSYALHTGEDRHTIEGFVAYVEATVLTFSARGLSRKMLRCKKRRMQEGKISTRPFAMLGAAVETDGLEVVEETALPAPRLELMRQFSAPAVNKLREAYGLDSVLSVSQIAVAHLLAGAQRTTGAAAVHGEGLCATKCEDDAPFWLVGPVSLAELCASGCTVEEHGVLRNWQGIDMRLGARLVLTDEELTEEIPVSQMTTSCFVVCRRHLGNMAYWNMVRDLEPLVDMTNLQMQLHAKRRVRAQHSATLPNLSLMMLPASVYVDPPTRSPTSRPV